MNRYAEKMGQIDHWSSRPDLEAEFKSSPIFTTDAELDEIQQELGSSLPQDYREFLKYYSGYIFFDTPEFPLVDGRGQTGRIAVFFNVHSLARTYEDFCQSEWPISEYKGILLLRNREEFDHEFPDSEGEYWVTWPKELLPIANNGGNATICLAISGDKIGSTYYWITNPTNSDTENVYLISDSFDNFILSIQSPNRQHI